MSTKSKKIELSKEFMATSIETEMKKTKVWKDWDLWLSYPGDS